MAQPCYGAAVRRYGAAVRWRRTELAPAVSVQGQRVRSHPSATVRHELDGFRRIVCDIATITGTAQIALATCPSPGSATNRAPVGVCTTSFS